MAYEEAGRGAPPIMLVHDLGSDHTCFASQFRHFRDRHRVVAVDLRGHGQSDKPNQPYTVALLADDLAWLCYELGLYRTLVLGNGMGGTAALNLAARYPDLPIAIVTVFSVTASPAAVAFAKHEAAPLLDDVSNRDLAASPLGCAVPVLRVALNVVKASLPEELNVLADKFLSEPWERAPPLSPPKRQQDGLQHGDDQR